MAAGRSIYLVAHAGEEVFFVAVGLLIVVGVVLMVKDVRRSKKKSTKL